MKKMMWIGLALTLCASAVFAGQAIDQQAMVEYRAAYEASRAQACEPEPPKNAFVIIPQFFNSSNDRTFINFNGARLRVEKSHANGAGATALYSRRLSDFITLNFMYEYGFLNISGGGIGPDFLGASKTHQRWDSHVVGFLPDFNFGEWGKLQLSIIQGFDRAHGNTRYANGVNLRNDEDGSNVTSLMAWYEKDFALSDSWKLTPYAGWRSLYAVVKQDGPDNNLWIHLVSAGMKLGYQCGKVGFNVRGGINYRTTKADVPAYGNRAVAPGVVHFSHRANLDRTVGSVGAGVSYVVNPRAIISVGYDGFYGSDTTNHTATLTAVFPF